MRRDEGGEGRKRKDVRAEVREDGGEEGGKRIGERRRREERGMRSEQR